MQPADPLIVPSAAKRAVTEVASAAGFVPRVSSTQAVSLRDAVSLGDVVAAGADDALGDGTADGDVVAQAVSRSNAAVPTMRTGVNGDLAVRVLPAGPFADGSPQPGSASPQRRRLGPA